MRLRAAALAAASTVITAATAQRVSSPLPLGSSLTDSSYTTRSGWSCDGIPYPDTLPANCSGQFQGTGFVGSYIDSCGFDYSVYCGSTIADDASSPTHNDVWTLAECMKTCDQYSGCSAATHVGQQCRLSTNATGVTGLGDPEVAALIKGSYRGMRTPFIAPAPTKVQQYRRQAQRSSTSVNVSRPTAPFCKTLDSADCG